MPYESDLTLSDVFIASVNSESTLQDTENVLLETVTLSYSKITWTYRPVNGDGSLAAPVTGGFDVKANKKL